MSPHHHENRIMTAEGCKLTLVSTLLFYLARDQLDLSSAALLGMREIVDDVVETLTHKREE